MNRTDLDALTASLTAFDSFDALLNTLGTYRPSILVRHGAEYVQLADAYDAAQAARGDERRAWRGIEENAAAQTAAAQPVGEIVLSVRLSGVAEGNPKHEEIEWLKVIHAVNRETPGRIGQPLRSYWFRANQSQWAEEYPEFRVLLGQGQLGLDTNYVQAKTADAAEALRRAVAIVTGDVVDDSGQTIRHLSDEVRATLQFRAEAKARDDARKAAR